MSSVLDTDVLVIGCGPAGTTCAIELCAQGLSVTICGAPLLHSGPPGQLLPGEARPLLTRLGVWDGFAEGPSTLCAGIASAWGGSKLQIEDSLFRPYGSGWILNRADFDAVLLARAERAGARFVAEQVVEPISVGIGSQGIRTRGGKEIRCRHVIDARGRNTPVDSKARRVDGLVGLHAKFEMKPQRDVLPGFLLVEACRVGWFYSCVGPMDVLTVVLLTDAHVVGGDREALWREALETAPWTRSRCGLHADQSPELSVSSAHTLLTAAEPRGSCGIAVGDASFALDPLSSRGMLHALASGFEAAKAVATAHRQGTAEPLAMYRQREQERCTRQLATGRALYRLEHRWLDSPFWAGRLAATRPDDRTGSRQSMETA